jgi:inheritance of peroxisomes protein 1 (Inp1)
MSSPSTPEHAPPATRSHIRRVHTLPPKFLDPTRTPPQVPHAVDAIETLFHAASAKVVVFEAQTSSSRPASRSGVKTAEEASNSPLTSDGSLSWISPTERTLAAGTFKTEIYLFLLYTARH